MESIRILIVEDDPIIGADLSDRVEEMGYQPLGPVESGEDALALFKQQVPDLVLMDIQLEGALDGIETTRLIRANHQTPIIFLTGNSDDVTFRKAKSAKPQAFLSKPFRGKDLKHAIELAIDSAPRPPEAVDTEPGTCILSDRLFIKMNERYVRLFYSDILWVEADNYYCKIVTKEREWLLGQTLKKFADALETIPNFMRIHRSYLINLQHVEEIGETFVSISKHQIPIGKTAKEALMAHLRRF